MVDNTAEVGWIQRTPFCFGARAEHRDGRDQAKNKEQAFVKCVNTPEFKNWHKAETMRRLGQLREIEARVEEQMQDKYLKVETYERS